MIGHHQGRPSSASQLQSAPFDLAFLLSSHHLRHDPYQACSGMAFTALWKWISVTQLNIAIQAFSDGEDSQRVGCPGRGGRSFVILESADTIDDADDASYVDPRHNLSGILCQRTALRVMMGKAEWRPNHESAPFFLAKTYLFGSLFHIEPRSFQLLALNR